MKTPLKLLGSFIAVMIIGVIAIKSFPVQAQTQPVPVVVTPTPKLYRVIDVSGIAISPSQTPASTLEAILNQLGSNGWRVVTTSGSLVILMR